MLEQSGPIAEGERRWQNEVMFQETESQAPNTTERDIEESREEETNKPNKGHKRPRETNANKAWYDDEIFLLIMEIYLHVLIDAWREIG